MSPKKPLNYAKSSDPTLSHTTPPKEPHAATSSSSAKNPFSGFFDPDGATDVVGLKDDAVPDRGQQRRRSASEVAGEEVHKEIGGEEGGKKMSGEALVEGRGAAVAVGVVSLLRGM
ncbi:hypothetical protein M3J09_002185 [Ascochyta lentis]